MNDVRYAASDVASLLPLAELMRADIGALAVTAASGCSVGPEGQLVPLDE